MRCLTFFVLSVSAVLFVGGSVQAANAKKRPAPCRTEGSITGYRPGVVVSPCGGGVRSGRALHARDQVRTSATGQVTFETKYVKTCILRRGALVIHPKPFVVLKLKRGSVFCKQPSDMTQWKFNGPNVHVRILPPPGRSNLSARQAEGDVVFGIVASKTQTIVKVDQGAVRASARGKSQVVPEGTQVNVPRAQPPGAPHPYTPTPAELETLNSLEEDATTTTVTDLPSLFKAQGEHYGTVIADDPAVMDQVTKNLGGIKLLRLTGQEFRSIPARAAQQIARFPGRIVVVAGAFAAMSSIVDELDDSDFQRLTGLATKQLLVVFVPVGDSGAPGPRVTKISVSNDHSNYVGLCPATITFTAELAVQGTGTVYYTWLRSDDAIGPIESVEVAKGPFVTVTTTWSLGSAGFSYDGWEALKVLGARVVASDQSRFALACLIP